MKLKKFSPGFLFLLLTACAVEQKDVDVYQIVVPFSTIEKGSLSGITRPRQFVIDSNQDWGIFWRTHKERGNVKLPVVNFETEMVLAIFAGQQPSGGYSIKIEKIKLIDETLKIYFSYREPGPSENVTLAITQPYHIVRAEKRKGKIEFIYQNNE